jgi:AcrR family transcriptional regulator
MNDHSVTLDVGSDADPVKPTARTGADKRDAILAAALRLVARTGLPNTPMSAIAREAGVAAGTLYLYFPSKEAMLNALYLDLLADQDRALAADASPAEATPAGASPAAAPLDPREALWHAWSTRARWHFDHPDAWNFLQQCRTSGVLTDETRAAEARMVAEGYRQFETAVATGLLRDLSVQVFWALFAGPIHALAQLRDAGEIEITEAVLRTTFDGVRRSVLPDGA